MSLNFAPFRLAGRRAVLLAGDEFSTFGAKTAVCYLRYRQDDIVSVVAPAEAGRRVQDVLGFGGDIPVVGSVEETIGDKVEIAIVGVAPVGGGLDAALKSEIVHCAKRGIDVVSGLHDLLGNHEAITGAAGQSGAGLWDVRAVAPAYPGLFWVYESGLFVRCPMISKASSVLDVLQ